MTRKRSHGIVYIAALMCAAAASAEPEGEGQIASPEENASSAEMMSTRPTGVEEPANPLPWIKEQASAAPASEGAAPKPGMGDYKPTMPFGRAEYSTKPIPAGPRSTVAVPVEAVDAIETSEPAPPTPVAPEADPVQENPEAPTELTSPIFKEEPTPAPPRKILLRVLNKVTAQSQLYKMKPGETVHFGQLDITAITCQESAPESQRDYAGLLDISEKLPTGEKPKALFRGWMYASSPSIAAIEHPVYDVTMVRCELMPLGNKPTPEEGEKPKGKAGKKR